MSSYKLIFLIFLTWNTQAEIIGGSLTERQEFAHLRIGSLYSNINNVDDETARCSGTWVAQKALTTAAHCFAGVLIERFRYRQKISNKQAYLKQTPVFINQVKAKIHFVVHPLYEKWLYQRFLNSQELNDPLFEELSFHERMQLVKKLINHDPNYDHDIALIFPSKVSSDLYLNISTQEYGAGERVKIAGYGIRGYHSIGKTKKMQGNLSYSHQRYLSLKKQLENNDIDQVTFDRKSKKTLERLEYFNYFDRLYIGNNTIESNQGIYAFKGKSNQDSDILGDSVASGDSGGALFVEEGDNEY